MTSQTHVVPVDVLIDFAARLFTAAGVPADDARAAGAALVRADCRGVESHGVARLPVYLNRIAAGGTDPAATPVIEREFGAIAVVDGGNGLGLVVGRFAMAEAIRRARLHGVGAVSCRNSGHFGPAAEFALMGPEHDCLTIAMTNVNVSMAPWGGIEPLLGNNPVAIAAPTSQEPFVLDMAMSTVARGKIRLAAARGESLPPGWALDADGVPTQDPAAALKGLITPLGGPKGSGLAIAVDIMAALLSGAATSPDVQPQAAVDQPQDVGHFFLALYVPAFVEYADYLHRIDAMLDRIRSSTRAANVREIYAPGDIENGYERHARSAGVCLHAATWESLSQVAARLGVSVPHVPA